MNLTLWSISDEQVRLNDLLEEIEGVLTPEIEERLAINEQNFREKSLNYSASIMKSRAEIAMLTSEKQRIEKILKSEKKKADILTERLSDALHLFGMENYAVDKYRLSFRKSTQVTIADEDTIPGKYKIIETSYDKSLIKSDISSGIHIPGACVVEKRNLQIK